MSSSANKKFMRAPEETTDLIKSFLRSQEPDTHLVCQTGRYVQVHGFLLQAASPVFQAVFESEGENYPSIREILLPDFSEQEIQHLKKLIYQGHVEINSEVEVQSFQGMLAFLGIENVDVQVTTRSVEIPLASSSGPTPGSSKKKRKAMPSSAPQQAEQEKEAEIDFISDPEPTEHPHKIPRQKNADIVAQSSDVQLLPVPSTSGHVDRLRCYFCKRLMGNNKRLLAHLRVYHLPKAWKAMNAGYYGNEIRSDTGVAGSETESLASLAPTEVILSGDSDAEN